MLQERALRRAACGDGLNVIGGPRVTSHNTCKTTKSSFMKIKVCFEFDHEGDEMATVTGSFSVTVNPGGPPPSPLALTPPGGSLPAETVGSPTTDKVATVSGGKPPYTFSLASGALPDGTSLTQTTNPDGSVDISMAGTPTNPGSFSFGLQVSDSTP